MATNKLEKPATSEIEDFHEDHKRRHHFWRNCFLSLFLIGFLLIGTAGWMLARTGLFEVPVLSGLAYRTVPTPSRVVATSPDDNTSLDAKLAAAQAAIDPATGLAELSLSEAEFNSLMRESNPDLNLAFTGDTIELFTPLKMEKATLYLTLELAPTVENGHLRINLTRAKIGRLGLPAGLFNWAGRVFQSRLVDTNDFVKQIEFQSIEVVDDHLDLRAKIPPSFFDDERRGEER